METQDFMNMMEKPHFSNINEVLNASDLDDNEKSTIIKYSKYCEYWLLRIKQDLLKSIFPQKDSFLKKLAIALKVLNSKRITGSRDKFIKEMFGDKQVHKFISTANGGGRFKINSNIIANKYFELDILSYFLDNDFDIVLAESKVKGQKIPEFKADNGRIVINVEAKKLDQEKVMDNIFGDRMTYGINHQFSDEEKEKGLRRIQDQFDRNFHSAMNKIEFIEKDEYFIIFMFVYYRVDFTGKYLIDHLNKLIPELISKMNLIGVVIPDSEKTYYIKNPSCIVNITDFLPNIPLDQYHLYRPGQYKTES